MNHQKAYTDRDVTVLFFLGAITGMLLIVLVGYFAGELQPANALEYNRTCDPDTEVAVLLGDGNEVPHACLDRDRVVLP